MTRKNDLSAPQTYDRSGREVWHDLVDIDIKRHQTPGGSYEYVAERLIGDPRLRERALGAMKEVLSRRREEGDRHFYAAASRKELDPARFESQARELAVGFKGRFLLATRRELLPRSEWMTDDQYDLAFYRFFEVMNAKDGARPLHRGGPLSLLFDAVPCRSIAEFEMPSRGVLTGHLVHEARMGDLAELLAVAGGLCADGHEQAERACDFVRLAALAPPLVVHNDTGPHLVFICAD